MADDLLTQALMGPPRQYWEALGNFVSMFSLVEENMQIALWRCARVKSPIAPAIFSGTRVDAASSYIKRIAEAENWPNRKRKELDDVFKQLGELTRVRNDILHYGASMRGPEEWVVSNKLVAHTQDRIRETKITPAILNIMTNDLHKVIFHLIVLTSRGKRVRHPPIISEVLRRAWLYKPDRQSDSQVKHNPQPLRTPKRVRQRSASRGSRQSRDQQ